MRTVFFDNDIVYKLAAYGLLDDACVLLGVAPRDVRVLDSCFHRINRLKGERMDAFEERYTVAGRLRALAFAREAVTSFALDAEAQALLHEVGEHTDGLDVGEQILLAGSLAAPSVYLVSGDKRWPPVVCEQEACDPVRKGMAGAVWCLECVVLALIARNGYDMVHTAISTCPQADTYLKMAFREPDEARTLDYLQREVRRLTSLYGGMMTPLPVEPG